MSKPKPTSHHSIILTVRLDKWLWAARFYKTRALAKEMILSGKVHYNGQRVKSSKNAEVGANIKIRQGFDTKEVVITALADVRRDANFAKTLYQETEQSLQNRANNAEARRLNILNNPSPKQKPDKKQRRNLINLKSHGSE